MTAGHVSRDARAAAARLDARDAGRAARARNPVQFTLSPEGIRKRKSLCIATDVKRMLG